MKVTKKFRAQLVIERSACARAEDIGWHDNTMTLFVNEPDSPNRIFWDYRPVVGGFDDGIEIGIVLEGDKVVDYDGVFSLPAEAIALLKEGGLDTTEVE